MCLIIQREPNFEIPYDKFRNAIITNPDGYGLSYPCGGMLYTLKSPSTPDPEKLYRMINEELRDVPLLIHLRFTTAGKTNMRNAHPFPVLEYKSDGIDLRMAHNGTIGKYKAKADEGESDTRSFIRRFVRPLMKRMVKAVGPEEILKDEFTQMLLTNEIPGGSVLSFIDGYGNFMNINEMNNGGGREDGWYFSNSYSFNAKHREPSFPLDVSEKKVYPSAVVNRYKEATNVQKFTDKYNVKLFDLTLLTDDTIDELVKSAPSDAALLIKEVLFELYQTRKVTQ